MTEESINQLNHAFAIHLGHINGFLNQINTNDRLLTVLWINKLRTLGRTLEEIRLRNDFSYYLLKSVINSKKKKGLQPPFNEKPPLGVLNNSRHLLAHYKPEYQLTQPELVCCRGELFNRSPDNGEFLQQQPIPKCGAFCYMAVVSADNADAGCKLKAD